MKFRFIQKTAVIFSVILALCSLSGCTPQAKQKTIYGCFDTVTTVIGYDTGKNFDEACRIVEEELQYWHQLSDIYHEYSGLNNACTLNLRANSTPVEVPEELFKLLQFGKSMYDLTDGECNIAMGAVLSLWHDAREEALSGGDAKVPPLEKLQAAAEHCAIEALVLDEEDFSVFFTDSELQLDLGAVAKGYAAEQIAGKLEDAGFTGYALSLGGNVRVIGTKPKGVPWVSGIENPGLDTPDAYVEKIELQDEALVTSGSYQRYFEVDGVRYHHIISPETLFPRNDYLSVTVRCPMSGTADTLSTALFSMSLSEGQELVNSFPDTEVWWVLPDGSLIHQ